MAWTKFQISLAVTMLVTGSINTLSTKWADRMEAVGKDGGAARAFNHPFLQAVGMFIGEFSCLIVFQILRCISRGRQTDMELGNQSFNPLIFLPASLCDMLGTSTMYIALNLTFASSFQMLRGAVMIFTALFSVIFLRRVIKNYMWLGMFTVVLGLIAVGVADMVFNNEDKKDLNGIISGDLLIIIAQIIVAVQMVYEEKFVTKHNVPALQAVGWEGFFGMTVLGILLWPFYYINVGAPFSGDPEGRLENVPDAFTQMGNNHLIIVAVAGNIISIAFYNFAGISVTKEMSATTRMVLDSCRTLIIWAVSLALMWQPFSYQEFLLQSLGFVFLIFGMCIYNNIVVTPLLRQCAFFRPDEDNDDAPLLRDHSPSLNDDESDALLGGGRRSVYDTDNVNA